VRLFPTRSFLPSTLCACCVLTAHAPVFTSNALLCEISASEFVQEGYHLSEIAAIYKVRAATVSKRVRACGLSKHTRMPDQELLEEVRTIKAGIGHNWGISLVLCGGTAGKRLV